LFLNCFALCLRPNSRIEDTEATRSTLDWEQLRGLFRFAAVLKKRRDSQSRVCKIKFKAEAQLCERNSKPR